MNHLMQYFEIQGSKKRRPNVSSRKNGGLQMIQDKCSVWTLTIRELKWLWLRELLLVCGANSLLQILCSAAAAAAKSLQSCPTLCDPGDSSPPGSTVPGILQARTLEWVAISFSNAWKWKVKVKPLSRVRLFATPWTAAYQAPPSMGFSRQEYWSGLPLPSPLWLKAMTIFRFIWRQ